MTPRRFTMSQSGVCIWYLIVNEHIFGPTYPPPPKKTKKKKKKKSAYAGSILGPLRQNFMAYSTHSMGKRLDDQW